MGIGLPPTNLWAPSSKKEGIMGFLRIEKHRYCITASKAVQECNPVLGRGRKIWVYGDSLIEAQSLRDTTTAPCAACDASLAYYALGKEYDGWTHAGIIG